jgi:hypothetical protein
MIGATTALFIGQRVVGVYLYLEVSQERCPRLLGLLSRVMRGMDRMRPD